MVVIFDLGLSQRRSLHHRPHDRLGAAIELAGHGELQELAGDDGFRVISHGQIGVLKITLDAEPAELVGLHLHPMGGEVAAFLTEFVDGNLVLVLALGAILLLDLPFDRQAVAVPAGHIIGVIAPHLEGAGDDVLQDLVERMADMEIAIGIGRAIVKDVFRPPCAGFAQTLVEPRPVPGLEPLGLGLGQARPHGKVGLGQEQGLGIVDAFRFGRLGLAHRQSTVGWAAAGDHGPGSAAL